MKHENVEDDYQNEEYDNRLREVKYLAINMN